ncbi:Histone-lysine N-methyltransferase MLL5, partial [Habropoda laboriosa]
FLQPMVQDPQIAESKSAASKTSTPSVIKLSGGGTAGGGEQLSPGPGPPPSVSPAEQTDANENDASSAATKRVDSYPQTAETTMSFVLQLGTVETSLEKKNSSGQPSSSLNQETTGTLVGGTDDSNKPQILQCLESTSEISAGHVISFSTVKSVSVTYPVAKTVREVQRITGPQTNTTQVLTTRVISQKLPSSTHQTQSTTPLTLNASTNVVHVPVNTQSLPSPGSGLTHVYPLQHAVSTQAKQQQARNQVGSCESKQQTSTVPSLQTSSVPLKVQPVSSQLMVSSSAVRAISTATSLPNIQRIHVKAQNLVGQGQTVNLQKVKAVTNVNQGVTVQRNTVPRIQTVQKSQVSTGTVQTAQFAVNQVTNNANAQRAQQGNSALQKAQANAAASMQKVAQVYNNQKVPSQVLSSHPNHKAQLQQIATGNQQQGLQKLQVQPQKTVTTVPRQQQSATTPVNNVQKPSNSVAGIQKVQVVGQVQCQQQSSQVQKHVQQVQPSHHQRSQSTAALQKSQTVATVNSSRVQTITNVCKSNSVPNITKASQNANLLAVNKQQVISQPQQSQQVHPAQNSSQLQQQLLQQTSQTQQQSQQHVVQKQQQQQQQQANANPPTQRSHSISNVHQKVATIATMPNNQRTQVMNSKMQQQQQQMVMRVGVPKNQAQTLQQGNMKSIPQKMANTVKPANSQNAVQQSLHRAANSQPVKIIQQQQNVIGPQNAQKQPGCIKTIPPQKPAQRNHAQKVAGIKTSLNTNVTAVKSQGPTTAVAQKTSIKTLLPQQTVASNMLMHKNQPIKIQQQGVQQKQLIATSQFPQQVRQQSGQVKTLLPVTSTEPRKDVENKTEPESREPKEDERQQRPTSPIIRIPPPYECLQYVLQDHNYGAPPPRTPSPPSPPSHPKQPINGAGSSTATSQHAYIYGKVVSGTNVEDDAASAISSETGRDVELEGEETETAPEGEGDDEDSVTRCICDFEHDDGYMICCDRCLVWQHVDCMGIDRSNIPDEYLCEICRPRRVDRQRARALQMRKREELLNSDTSSDTSSTSSADTDVGVNTIPKKRTLQQQVPRRKSEPPQVRRLNNNNNNNNNNVAKRQRRDSHPRQSSAVRKKETTKRGPGKRKVKRRMSLEDKEEDSQDAWSSTNVTPLRQWIERYEEAVTNHYSPELRARISSIKVNGTHSDLRQSNMSMIATGKCRLNVHSNNVRFLVATMYLQPNTPVVELRGKYMLSTQHRPSYPQGRQHSQRPGPFVFFYRLPRDGTEVCVDTRTYGNDARFVRRSCKPNAEVKHCIEKGTLHLYIVTTTAIEKNAEITIRHEQHDLLLSPNPNGPIMPIVCACNNPRECQIVSLNQLNRRGSNGTLAENADGRERRRRGRRNTVCEDSDSSTAIPNSTVIAQPVPPPTIVSTVSAPPRRTVTTTVTNTVRQVPKEEPKRRIARESLSSDNYTPPTTPTMLVPESTPNNRSLCPVEDDFIEQLQSPLIEQNDERHTMTESVKQEVNSHEHVNSDETMRQKLSVDIPQNFHVKSIKSEESMTVVQIDASLVKEENLEVKKEEYDEMECDAYIHLESKPSVKDEYRAIKNDTDHQRDKSKKEHVIKKEVEHLEVEKGTVEIVDQNEEGDTEMEDFSSPIALMESDAILKQRVAEMKLEFGGSISEMVKIENEKCDDDKRSEDAKSEVKSDDNMSIDEFDVEAQMKKITGDDGNDYKEKVDTSSEKDKSMDGIEGLMESSKEDSESEDKDMDDVKYETSFKSFNINHEEKLFKEFENKTEPECIIENNTKETEQSQESQKTEQLSALVTSSEESIFESTSSNMDAESIAEPPKIFHSIPPLSERIRKKTETTSTPKSQLNFEAAIIESTIDMETVDGSKNGEQKSMLSTALRELLEAKLDDLASDSPKEETIEENNTPYIEPKSESPEQIIEVQESVLKPAPQIIQNEEVPPVKEEEAPPKEIKRLKDPRTVVPNTMPAPAFKPDTIPPVKRKLSISEYRKRKQQSSGTPPEPEPSNDASATDKGGARGRSDSASSGTSSLSSDEEGSKISLSLDIPSLTALPLFTNAESEEKKGGEEGTIGWSAAPTLVERQRENLTERLKREFGLFLSDDEEERARKHGLTAEAILKARKTSPPHPSVSNTPPGYPVPQLPPQPYIPPPGSASIHYPQFQSKPPCPVQYPNFTVPQSTSQPIYTNAAPQASANKQAQQFLVPQASQAPPGSNPYPPQFIPPSTTAVSISKYSSVTPPSGNQMYPASGQSQKQFYNHPAPRS